MDGLENKRLKIFKRECVLAGPRSSVLAMYKLLKELGANTSNDKQLQTIALLSNKNARIVLFLRNEGVNKKFPDVLVLSRSWWDMYHNRKKTGSKMMTYNIPLRWKFVIEHVLQLEDIPTLIPE